MHGPGKPALGLAFAAALAAERGAGQSGDKADIDRGIADQPGGGEPMPFAALPRQVAETADQKIPGEAAEAAEQNQGDGGAQRRTADRLQPVGKAVRLLAAGGGGEGVPADQ